MKQPSVIWPTFSKLTESSNNLEVPLAKTAKAQPSFSAVVALAVLARRISKLLDDSVNFKNVSHITFSKLTELSNNLEVPLAKTAKAQPSFSEVVALAASKEGWPISQFHPTTPVKPACSAKAAAPAPHTAADQPGKAWLQWAAAGRTGQCTAARGTPYSRHATPRRIAEYT